MTSERGSTTRASRTSTVPPRTSTALGASHVLVVDDDPETRGVLERLLRTEGFVIATASDGEQALAHVATKSPDLVITDLVMEPMGGVELCGRLHEIDRDLPVIVMTGMTDRQLVIDCLRVGAEDYLTKPIEWDAMLFRVNRALERRARKLDEDHLRRTLNERLVLSSIREQELADGEARQRAQLNALLESLHEGVVIGAPDGRVLLVNAAARVILDLGDAALPNIDALYARPVLDLAGVPIPNEQRPLMRALRGEAFDGVEAIQVGGNGAKRHLVTMGTSVRDEHGEVVLAIITFRDVTEQKKLEQQREEFLALVSHDLRSPLNSILMALFVLKESTKNASFTHQDVVKIAERGERNVGRMTRMLDELAEATSLELGGVPLHQRPADLRKILVSALEGIDEARTRRVEIADDGGAWPVLADTSQLERVVGNLLTNALKYSGPDKTVIARLTRQGDEVRLDVVDEGIGIAPESTKILFERYGRTRAGRAAASGLGLGLYIARLIVDAHGGRIEVASEVGRGSTFSLFLPLRAPSPAKLR